MSSTDLGAWATSLPLTALAALAVLLAAFAIGAATGKHRTVDVAWGPAFAVVALVGWLCSAGHGDPVRRALALALTAVWGLRLGIHIWTRSRGKPEDPRYEALLAKAPGSQLRFAFVRVYLLQALLVWIISMPVQVAQFGRADPGPQTAVACALWLIGFVFETVGDWQLARFKADPTHRGMLMDKGLWRYTRHPNYFGDACVWWGLFLLAADQWAGVCTVACPVIMTLLLTVGSGMRLTDRHMSSTRPDHADYVRRTSGFIPLPPRRRA